MSKETGSKPVFPKEIDFEQKILTDAVRDHRRNGVLWDGLR